MKKEKIKIISFGLGLFVLAASLVIFVGILPLWRSIKAEELELKKTEFKIKDLENKRKNIAEYKKRQKDLELNGELIKTAILKKGEEFLFVQELEEAAKLAGVELEIKDYEPPLKKTNESEGEKVQSETIDEMGKRQEEEKKIEHFQLIFKGNYPRMLDFIYKLENMRRSFVLKSVKLGNVFETKGDIEAAIRRQETPDKFLLKGEIIISFSWQ